MMGMARDEATHAESRPENKYDTRALEASYLAAGQGKRLLELKTLTGWMDQKIERATRCRAGALVHLDLDGEQRWVFLAPSGGPRVEIERIPIALVSVSSPLGTALLGLEVGDGEVVERPSGEQDVEVIAIS